MERQFCVWGHNFVFASDHISFDQVYLKQLGTHFVLFVQGKRTIGFFVKDGVFKADYATVCNWVVHINGKDDCAWGPFTLSDNCIVEWQDPKTQILKITTITKKEGDHAT